MNSRDFENMLVEYNNLRKQPAIIEMNLKRIITDFQVIFADRLNYLSQALCRKDFVESGAEILTNDSIFYTNSPLHVAIPQSATPEKRKEIYLASIFFTSDNWKKLADCYLDEKQRTKQWAAFKNHPTTQNVIPPDGDVLCELFGHYILQEGVFESETNRYKRLSAQFKLDSTENIFTALTNILRDVQPKLDSWLNDTCMEAVVERLSGCQKWATRQKQSDQFPDTYLFGYIKMCANKSTVRKLALDALANQLDKHLTNHTP